MRQNPVPDNYRAPVIQFEDDPRILISDAIRCTVKAVQAIEKGLPIYVSVHFRDAGELLKGALSLMRGYSRLLSDTITFLWYLSEENIDGENFLYYWDILDSIYMSLTLVVMGESSFFEGTRSPDDLNQLFLMLN